MLLPRATLQGNLAAAAASAGRGKQGLDMLGAIAMDLSEHPSPKKRPASGRGRRRSAPGAADADGGRRAAAKSNLASTGDPEFTVGGMLAGLGWQCMVCWQARCLQLQLLLRMQGLPRN
jgi:hypothetical protein